MTDKSASFTLKIPLFEDAEVLVKENQEVKESQPIIRLGQDQVVEVDLACGLKVKPIKVVSLLEVGLGREVKEGQILAQKKKFLIKRKIFCPVTGRVEAFAEDQGILKIRTNKESLEVKAPVLAKVVGFKKNFLVLQFPALVFPAKAAFGQSSWGNLKAFSGHLFDLKEVKGQIVLAEKLNLALFNKLEALGAVGAVCLKMGKEIEREADEAGILVLAEKDYKKVCQHKGKRAKVDVGDRRLIIAR